MFRYLLNFFKTIWLAWHDWESHLANVAIVLQKIYSNFLGYFQLGMDTPFGQAKILIKFEFYINYIVEYLKSYFFYIQANVNTLLYMLNLSFACSKQILTTILMFLPKLLKFISESVKHYRRKKRYQIVIYSKRTKSNSLGRESKCASKINCLVILLIADQVSRVDKMWYEQTFTISSVADK